MKTQQKKESVNSDTAERKAYAAPELKVFGPVGALTQSGTGASPEDVMTNPNGMMVCTGGPNRQMC